MTLMQNIGFWCLVVTVALLLLRVWRLECRVDRVEPLEHTKVDAMFVHENLNESFKMGIGHTNERVASLARALGYEWKRTEAKEGWERKPVTGAPFFGCAIQTPLRNEKWSWLDEQPADRRKGERRKPVPEIKVKQFCDSCAEKSARQAKRDLEREIARLPKKKPRRAH